MCPVMVRKDPYPRTRSDRNWSRPAAGNSTYVNFTSTPNVYTTTYGTGRVSAYVGVSRRCTDVVTPGFAARSASGEVCNNPFEKVSYEMACGGTGPITQWVTPFPPYPTTGRFTGTYPTWLLAGTKMLLPPLEDAYGMPYAPPEFTAGVADKQHLAKVKALSNVDQSLASGLVGLGELKSTLNSFIHPLSAIRQYLKRWKLKPTRKGYKLYINDGEGLVPAVASQYLELYYGLKPFLKDLESYVDAYVQSGYQPERKTARGSESLKTETFTTQLMDRSRPDWDSYDLKTIVTTEWVYRSGILYEPSPLTTNKVMGLRVGDVLPAIYELTPWSFFLDYFSNFGNLIQALTPRMGVRYLSAWDTVDFTQKTRIECTDSWCTGNFRQVRKSTEWAERVCKVRLRSPTGVYSNLAPVLHTGVWESKAKVAAVIALLTQQIGQHVVPSAIWKA